MTRYLNKNFVTNFFIILGIFAFDRITKLYVISESEKNLSSELFVSKTDINFDKQSDILVEAKKALGNKCSVCWKIRKEPCERHPKCQIS